MPGMFDRVARLARTPKGQRIISQATAKAQQLAKDPANRARVQRVRDEVNKRMNSKSSGAQGPAAEPGHPTPTPTQAPPPTQPPSATQAPPPNQPPTPTQAPPQV